jgi:ribosomal protein S12 methylthiotransferase
LIINCGERQNNFAEKIKNYKFINMMKEKITVGFINLGCAKNLVDSEVMAGQLIQDGYALAASPDTADVVVVNTCSFIRDAREESFEVIAEVIELKSEFPDKKLIVTGCLTQRYQKDFADVNPDIDAFIGLDDLPMISKIVAEITSDTNKQIYEISTENPTKVFEPTLPGLSFSGNSFSYIKIAEGCTHRCAFCAIPNIRGKHRSRTIDSIVGEAEAILENGIKEINLISQDTTFYGNDLKDGSDLPKLMRAISNIGGDFKLRVLYCYPDKQLEEILETMGELPQACHYLDIPIQHSHPEILEAMDRKQTIEFVEKIPEMARKILPDITLRTTCLLGFPGERKEHIDHLMDYIEKSRFDHMGSFIFSAEEGTPAYDMGNVPSVKETLKYQEQLMQLQMQIVAEKLESKIGQKDRVLLVGRSIEEPDVWIARSDGQAPDVDSCTYVVGAEHIKLPDFIEVEYTDIAEYDLVAKARVE